MAMDIQREHWRGAIALKLELHADEVTTVPPPAPLFVLAPRLGYLPQISQQALAHFESVLPPGKDEPWFEYRGVPLKWHIPTGCLYDLLSVEEGEYPWCLTIHFRSYPTDVLQSVSGERDLQASYLNSLKEAAYVLAGNSNSVMSLTKTSQTELWQNVLDAKNEVFFTNIEKMDLSKPARSRIPVRIYARKKVFDSFTGWPSIDYASKALKIDTDTDGERTPRQLFKEALGGVSKDDLETTLRVVAAGVEIGLDDDISQVYSHLKNADMWLYLVIKPAPK